MEDWKAMVQFSLNLIKHGRAHAEVGVRRGGSPIDEQRIAVVLIDQATELLMKAFLIKRGYIVHIPKKYIKSTDTIESIKGKRTLGFYDTLTLVKEKIPNIDRKKIEVFHELRNKIYHLSLNIDEDKRTEIERFLPVLEAFFREAFEDIYFPTSDDVMELVSERYR